MKTNKTTFLKIAVFLLLAVLVVTACSSDSGAITKWFQQPLTECTISDLFICVLLSCGLVQLFS